MSKSENKSNKTGLPYSKPTNQYNVSQTSIFKGYMFDVVTPSNEFQWSGRGIILFDCGGTKSKFKGDFILFDRFLNFEFVASTDQKQFICWNRLPLRRPFSVSLFAEMIYHYGTNGTTEDDALLEAYSYLEKYEITVKSNSNNNSGYSQVKYDFEALSKSSFVKERVNPNSIYFYLGEFFQLAQIYPKKLNDIKKIHAWQRTKICEIYNKDLESLCYPQSVDLSFNPLGRITQYALSKCYRMRKFNSSQHKLSVGRVWYYEEFIRGRYLTTADNSSSTRIMLTNSDLIDIRKNNFYNSLFIEKKVLRLEKMPVSDEKIEYLSSSSSSSSSSSNEVVYANYLIDSSSIRNCEIITDKLRSIKNKTNNMPPLHIMKKQYFFRLKDKKHDLYIEAFGTDGDDFSGYDDHCNHNSSDSDDYSYDYDDDKNNFTEHGPWETFQRVTFSKSEKEQLSKQLHEHQWKAVRSTFKEPLVLITGGPGRGKTSAVLVNIWKARPLEYLIVAPTGIAVDRIVKQIEQSISKDVKKPCCLQRAETIEYVVELLRHNPTHLIGYTTALMIDESSCIDESKFAELLNCLPYLQQLVMIGDVDQIAPIGKGYPFRDMLNTLKTCSFRLTKNFRTDNKALIENAETILTGKVSNFKFSFKLDPQRITHTTLLEREDDNLEQDILSIVKYIESKVKNAQHQIQFITPYNKTRKQICQILYRHWFNFDHNFSLRHFHVNQRVIFLKNYKTTTVRFGYVSDAVKNGETGIIVSIYDIKMKNNRNKKFQEKISYTNTHKVGVTPKSGYRRWIIVKTATEQLKRIDLISIQHTVTDGSCITGHKSQGSEYPYVVIVLDYFNRKARHIVNRNWAYTSYTRSKKAVFVLYTKQTVSSNIKFNRHFGSFIEVVSTPRPTIDTFLWLYLKELNGGDKFSLKRTSSSSSSSSFSNNNNSNSMRDDDESSDYDGFF